MEETNPKNLNEQKEQKQMQEKEQIQDLVQQQNSHSENTLLTIIIPFESLILKTIMSQIQKPQSFKKHFILNIQSREDVRLLLLAQQILQREYEIRNLQFTLNKSLSHCLFINMVDLQLQEIHFDNCEFMGFLDAPELKTIYLSNNKITNFKSFAKMNLPSLKTILIEGSRAKKTFLQRTKFSKQCEALYFEFINNDIVIEEDLRSLVKFEPRFYKDIYIQSKYRIERNFIQEKLKQRFVKQSRVVKWH